MQTIGYIDVEKYQCISKHICTNEVIITPERVRHIKERRGEDFYEQYAENSMLNISRLFFLIRIIFLKINTRIQRSPVSVLEKETMRYIWLFGL